MKFSLVVQGQDGNPRLTWLAKGIAIVVLLPLMIAVVALNSTASTWF